jgi:septal ring factor EnvC (AmiA/AmiB activator)
MAKRGVPQDEVYQAADALLAAGERPTVERVRLALGRGSPNALAPMLERWWSQLAQRLAQRLALPAVPDAVAAAFAHAWEVAIVAGQTHAEALVAPERAALAEVLAQAEGAMSDHRAQVAVLEGRLGQVQATADKHYADWRVSDTQVGQLSRQLGALEQEQQALAVRRDALEARNSYLESHVESVRAAAATERETLQAHIVQIEDRAHAEIDRLRQEAKAIKSELTAQAREHATALREAQRAMHAAQREASAQAARAETLGAQLTRLTRAAKTRSVAPTKRAPSAPRARSTK